MGFKYTVKRIKALSFAELLLAMTVIGIIASYTIPSFIQNVQASYLKIAWKQTYSIIDQATRRLIIDKGGTIKNVSCANYNTTCFMNAYIPYFNKVKSCIQYESRNICWHDDNTVKYLNDTAYFNNAGDYASIVLNNGALVSFYLISTPCNTTHGNVKVCGYIYVDINGWKNPNTIGKDIFKVLIQENGIKPAGYKGSYDAPPTSTCIPGSTDSNNTGLYCSYLYLIQ